MNQLFRDLESTITKSASTRRRKYTNFLCQSANRQIRYDKNYKFRKTLKKQVKEEQEKHDEEYETKFDYRGVKVLVRLGDLVNENSEAIVNPANDQLKHAGGAAAAIAGAAGPEFEKACIDYIKECEEVPTGTSIITPAGGDLKCHKVIHTVGPVYQTKKANNIKAENHLRDAIKSVLEIMKDEGLHSVSIPAISTGIFNFPLPKCCKIMAKTLRDFIDQNPQSMEGKQIVLCNFDEPTTAMFRDNFEDYFRQAGEIEQDDDQDDESEDVQSRDDDDDDSDEEAKVSR